MTKLYVEGTRPASPNSLTDLHFPLSYSEWLSHQHRDTYASIVGHPTLLNYMAIADGEATGRVKFELAEVRLRTCSLLLEERMNDADVCLGSRWLFRRCRGCSNLADRHHRRRMTERLTYTRRERRRLCGYTVFGRSRSFGNVIGCFCTSC